MSRRKFSVNFSNDESNICTKYMESGNYRGSGGGLYILAQQIILVSSAKMRNRAYISFTCCNMPSKTCSRVHEQINKWMQRFFGIRKLRMSIRYEAYQWHAAQFNRISKHSRHASETNFQNKAIQK